MKKEDLITKWLDNHQLTKQESEAFRQLDAYDSYIKIAETAKRFEAPEYNVDEQQNILKEKISYKNSTSNKTSISKILLRIAAIFIVGIGAYFSFFKEYDTTVDTLVSEQSTHVLPDASEIKLNALSSITYDKKNWDDKRKITLQGEAYFNVAKGKKFDVYTSQGVISVIGTKFNVKQREDFFEVTCYEGVVSVTSNDQIKYLRAGDILEINNGKIFEHKTLDFQPKWYDNKSLFYKTPFTRVLKEFKWQYGVQLNTKNIDTAKLFTGNFVHSNIETALKSITIPMRLKYVIDNKTITLYKE